MFRAKESGIRYTFAIFNNVTESRLSIMYVTFGTSNIIFYTPIELPTLLASERYLLSLVLNARAADRRLSVPTSNLIRVTLAIRR